MTLFDSGDSVTAAELAPCVPSVPSALRLSHAVRDPIPYFMLMMGRVAERAGEFDIIHFTTSTTACQSSRCGRPTIRVADILRFFGQAIATARAFGVPLRIAAKVDKVDE